MPILKRRLDICGREKTWDYVIEASGSQYRVTARQVAHNEPTFTCSCGTSTEGEPPIGFFLLDPRNEPCAHISEVQRDLSIARQAAAQMVA